MNCEPAIQCLSTTQSLLIVTGAGISAESGIPTFRGPNGLYTTRPELERILSASGWRENPRALWEFVNEARIRTAAAKPNRAHELLAKWEKRFEHFLIATQNIDGLHQSAGSELVSELHGSLWQMAAPRTVDYTEDPEFSAEFQQVLAGNGDAELLRKWSEEDGHEVWQDRDVPFARIPPYRDPLVRPNILLFEEPYGNRLVWVDQFIRERNPQTLLAVGCSGSVGILHRLIADCRRANPGCRIISINSDEPSVRFADVEIRLGATEAMKQLDQALFESGVRQ